ncbi:MULTISPECIES: Asr1405/Asl0597 family protein [unclassified Tolypothrix]|uniref:Asr1405/Asl0597 family protein n=1 Tax=unclassified Tolypothrix TaxID=2649714 RepID=UPI0005EAAC2C|nr:MULTISPECIES: Asr1405/Asl0597 family protein [unclassified Tolypothrix]BAY91683.1 hypothetical protein NIES3275_37080 [Microchaete diplosiphon NIES-3275]EKF05195.1 hypothetical protein FDUTEX481_01365 [Tolypothrix sp. PCC 7601]MBE9084307.1 hypothetical protein [Tolypothrix sp. LEGE 11397]UYD25699.1 hypothetical protein HGR01_30905 [Tolypothrix sp. PCC 7712]UYD32060.1 hypothetical protein HG267_23630 [Tolypothrix sp. PCC 7601]
MKSFSSEVETRHTLEVNWADRWQVYQRLQQLEIPCWCESNQPLQVEITNPLAIIQLWSVMRQFSVSRQDIISSLEKSWLRFNR